MYRDPNGRQQTRPFRRKTDAQRWLDEQSAAIVTGQYISPAAGRVTVREHVDPLLGNRRIAAVRPSDVQAWVKRLLVEHRLAPSTVAVVHGVQG